MTIVGAGHSGLAGVVLFPLAGLLFIAISAWMIRNPERAYGVIWWHERQPATHRDRIAVRTFGLVMLIGSIAWLIGAIYSLAT